MLRHNPIAKLLKKTFFKQRVVKNKKKYSRKDTSQKKWLKGYWEWKNENSD